jgi:hypothetical protein
MINSLKKKDSFLNKAIITFNFQGEENETTRFIQTNDWEEC